MGEAYDEMASGRGQLRPHWRNLMGTIWSFSPAQLAEKQARARAQFAEAEDFLAVYGNDAGRPAWSFDLLPLILPAAEWARLVAGLAQRARLLDLILADLYGPQRLIEQRLVPPYLVYANPEFLRPLRSVRVPGGAPHLYFYAADLVRMPDGAWRVFNDRTQAAAGVGYALRHRRVLARTFREAFRTSPVRPLQPFVDLWQASLQKIGTSMREDPRSVLLTPGPYNDAYIEHVYLARELGIPLVQGSDLTVRDDVVYMKALEGLMRVDVIYRRLDGGYCDPVELQEDSAIGIAGIVQAARMGSVALLNLPGSALIETPAFAPFLPELARRLLGEELKLPAVTTWWCGQRLALEAVKANLTGFVFRPTFAPDPDPVDPAKLAEKERAALAAEIVAQPERFVALERVTHGVAPTMTADGLAPAPIMLRVAAIWHNGDWAAMPGGVARVVGGDALYRSTLRHGGTAKDVWVLTEEAVNVNVTSVRTRAPAIKRAAAGTLQSRAADDLYWLGRHAERIDTGGRLLRATLTRMTGGGFGPRDLIEIGLLARALNRVGWIEPNVAAAPPDGPMFLFGIASAASTGVMGETLSGLRRLAVAVRDRLSLDMWWVLNHVLGNVRERLTGAGDADRLLEALDDLVRSIAAFAGLVAENMTRGAGWHFLNMGRRLERGISVAHTVGGVLSGSPAQCESGLRLALELCDSTITHRTRYPAEPRPASALDLVLADAANPRALMFQLGRLHEHIAALDKRGAETPEAQAVSALARAVADFPFAETETGIDSVDLTRVLALLDNVAERLMGVSDSITRTFFSHVQRTKPVFTFHPRETAAG